MYCPQDDVKMGIAEAKIVVVDVMMPNRSRSSLMRLPKPGSCVSAVSHGIIYSSNRPRSHSHSLRVFRGSHSSPKTSEHDLFRSMGQSERGGGKGE